MYLSYSGYKKYLECPLAYYHSYIAKTKKPTPDDRIGMVYGSVVGNLVEDFYNLKLWKEKNPVQILLAKAPSALRKVMAEESKNGTFLWKDNNTYKKPDDILADVIKSVPQAIEIIRRHRLLGVDAKAEVKLDSDVQGHRFGGRADVIMTRLAPHSDRIIYDGKGSKYRDQYVDVRQLYWYSLLNQVQRGFLPDRVAFVFWRFDSATAVDWHPVTSEHVLELREEVLAAIGQIEASKKKRLPQAFEARPSASKCRLCPYTFTCQAGQTILSKDRPADSDTMGVEDVQF